MDCLGLASVQATTSGIIDVNGEKIPALRGNRLSDGAPLTVYPGEVPARLPGQALYGISKASSLRRFVRR
ncbi:YcjX family protein [Escherichia coli]